MDDLQPVGADDVGGFPPGTFGYELATLSERIDEIVASMPWYARWYGRRVQRRADALEATIRTRQEELVMEIRSWRQ